LGARPMKLLFATLRVANCGIELTLECLVAPLRSAN
jgi:hypothetical protein